MSVEREASDVPIEPTPQGAADSASEQQGTSTSTWAPQCEIRFDGENLIIECDVDTDADRVRGLLEEGLVAVESGLSRLSGDRQDPAQETEQVSHPQPITQTPRPPADDDAVQA